MISNLQSAPVVVSQTQLYQLTETPSLRNARPAGRDTSILIDPKQEAQAVYVVPQRRHTIRKQRLIPRQRSVGQSISHRPPAVRCHIAISEFIQTQIDECFCVGFYDGFVWAAAVVVIRIPSESDLLVFLDTL